MLRAASTKSTSTSSYTANYTKHLISARSFRSAACIRPLWTLHIAMVARRELLPTKSCGEPPDRFAFLFLPELGGSSSKRRLCDSCRRCLQIAERGGAGNRSGSHSRDSTGADHLSGAENIDSARNMWWIGLRDAEKEKYEGAGGNCEQDERDFRAGFEDALRLENRGKLCEGARP
jgi:hypothetical protein